MRLVREPVFNGILWFCIILSTPDLSGLQSHSFCPRDTLGQVWTFETTKLDYCNSILHDDIPAFDLFNIQLTEMVTPETGSGTWSREVITFSRRKEVAHAPIWTPLFIEFSNILAVVEYLEILCLHVIHVFAHASCEPGHWPRCALTLEGPHFLNYLEGPEGVIFDP